MTTVASDTAGSSPSIADTSDVFPSPVLPTTATKLPTGISKLIFVKVGLSACQVSKVSDKALYVNQISKTRNRVKKNYSTDKIE